jgi:hypothetical protein
MHCPFYAKGNESISLKASSVVDRRCFEQEVLALWQKSSCKSDFALDR